MIPDDKLKEFMPYDIAAFLENKGFEVCRNEVSDPEWNEQFENFDINNVGQQLNYSICTRDSFYFDKEKHCLDICIIIGLTNFNIPEKAEWHLTVYYAKGWFQSTVLHEDYKQDFLTKDGLNKKINEAIFKLVKEYPDLKDDIIRRHINYIKFD